ncbi:hypothetical protein PG984_014844 [Apiospora sp. TS-2023a]
MFDKLCFWKKWAKSSSGGPYQQLLDLVLDASVFWCTVVLLITTTAVVLGLQLRSQSYGPADENNVAFLALLWQALLQLLANYCTVVPVLREQRQRKKGFYYSSSLHQRQALIRVHYVVFYGCVACSVVATVLAPVLLKAQCKVPSDIANFASNIFAATAASQLAAGITSGLRSRE